MSRIPKLLIMALAAAPGMIQAQDSGASGPVVWGAPSDAKGCVIFREVQKTDVVTSDMETTVKAHYELQVLESQGYTPSHDTYPEDQRTLDALQIVATQDRIRFVKLRAPFSPADLDVARARCREAMGTSR